MHYYALLFCAALLAVAPQPAYALLPPDVIVSVGAQAAGFFSFFAVVFGLVVSSIGVSFVLFGRMVARNSVYIAFGVLALALVGFQVMYFADMRATQEVFNNRIAALETRLATQNPTGPPIGGGVYEDECDTCRFFGDGVLLFVPGEDPIVVSLDFNRRQEPSSSFTHYYFLDGLLPGGPMNSYQAQLFPNAAVEEFGFVNQFNKQPAFDGSVRDNYTVSITENENDIDFSIATTTGDFITRSTQSYTQFQSVGTTSLQLGADTHEAFYFTETALSDDFTKRIFFDGFDDVSAHTHQFILWDEAGNFYLIDDTQVASGPAAYPTHSWLLFKDGSTGATKKGFRTDIIETDDTWIVTIPDFAAGQIELEEVAIYKFDGDRRRSVVSGVISDDVGERVISGVLHHIED